MLRQNAEGCKIVASSINDRTDERVRKPMNRNRVAGVRIKIERAGRKGYHPARFSRVMQTGDSMEDEPAVRTHTR